MNDNELLELLSRDPQKGLEAAVEQYSAYVMKIAYVKLSEVCTKEDMEEAVSDIFLMFYNAVKDNADIRSVRAYLSVIARRHCINLFHKHSRAAATVELSELENVIAQSCTEENELIDAVKQLGEPDSYIFIRKYYFGQRNKDIAKELGMGVSTLNSRVSRGLDKLRKMLREGDK